MTATKPNQPMSTELAILPSKIVPKPTKSEIIQALVNLRTQEIDEERTKAVEAKAKLQKEIESALIKVAAKVPNQNSRVTWHSWKRSATDDFEISSIEVKKVLSQDEIPKEIQEKIFLHSKHCETARKSYQRKDIEREIRDKLANIQPTKKRVEAILSDKESVRFLKELLGKL